MKCGNSGEAATWFSECARMRARPPGPAESSALHYFARSGPTKEAHRRALNRSGGHQRSVAGQGHGRVLPVTLPRGASDQHKQAEAGSPRSPTPGGPIRGGVGGPIRGGIRGPLRGPIRGESRRLRNRCAPVRMPLGIAAEIRDGDGPGAEIGLGAAGTLHPAAFGRCPHPAGIPPGPTDAGVKLVPPRCRRRRLGWPGGDRRLRGLQLDPGSGRMVPMTRVGRSARRAASPAG